MNPQTLAELIADIDAEDPVELGEFSIDESDARTLMASHFCELDRRLAAHGLQTEERLEMMAAIAAHTMVENLVLHMRRLRAGENGIDAFREWMGRHGMH
tara:strand:- start:1574 stop:1873 length:300 start_codon:yes stop_codon:yes gene_type:complete